LTPEELFELIAEVQGLIGGDVVKLFKKPCLRIVLPASFTIEKKNESSSVVSILGLA